MKLVENLNTTTLRILKPFYKINDILSFQFDFGIKSRTINYDIRIHIKSKSLKSRSIVNDINRLNLYKL